LFPDSLKHNFARKKLEHGVDGRGVRLACYCDAQWHGDFWELDAMRFGDSLECIADCRAIPFDRA
jgi:hypothetical protein